MQPRFFYVSVRASVFTMIVRKISSVLVPGVIQKIFFGGGQNLSRGKISNLYFHILDILPIS